MSLKQQAVQGITWTLIERFGLQGIKLIIGVWLARLLTPADYGLVGMISVFFAVAMVFVESGFGAAYVQMKEARDFSVEIADTRSTASASILQSTSRDLSLPSGMTRS